MTNCTSTGGRTINCGNPTQKKYARCRDEAWSKNQASFLLDAAAIIPGGGDLADVARVGAASVTTVVGTLGGDAPAQVASLAGGSVAIANIHRGSFSKAAGEAIPIVGEAIGLYAVWHDLNNVSADIAKCMAGSE